MTDETRARVLLADDSETMRCGIRRIVESLGHTVVAEASDGKEAIKQALTHKPGLILLDINMPVMTGTDAIKGILEVCPDAIVVMMTSVSDMDTVEACIENGAANYILKSASAEEIAESIAETWEMRAELE